MRSDQNTLSKARSLTQRKALCLLLGREHQLVGLLQEALHAAARAAACVCGGVGGGHVGRVEGTRVGRSLTDSSTRHSNACAGREARWRSPHAGARAAQEGQLHAGGLGGVQDQLIGAAPGLRI